MAAIFAWKCTSTDNPDRILNLTLPDSLAAAAGKFDTIEVDIFRMDGAVFRDDVYVGPYSIGGVSNLHLGAAPSDYVIVVTAFKDGVEKVRLRIEVHNGNSTPPVFTWLDTNSVRRDTILPRVRINPTPLDTRITSVDISISGIAWDSAGLRTVSYRINNGAPVFISSSDSTWLVSPIFPDGRCDFTITAEDSSGNRDSATVTIHKLSGVLFVRKGFAGNGTSWADAYGEVQNALSQNSLVPPGTTIWVGKGLYSPPVGQEFFAQESVSVFGGFGDAGTQTSVSERNILSDKSELFKPTNDTPVIGIYDSAYSPVNFFTLDGFTITGSGNGGVNNNNGSLNLTIENCRLVNMIDATPFYHARGTARVINSYFGNNLTSGNGVVWMVGSNATLEITNTIFERNTTTKSQSGGILAISGYLNIRASRFFGNNNSQTDTTGLLLYPKRQMVMGSEAIIDIDSSEIELGIDGIENSGGQLIYGLANRNL